ncbi:MULTISPECIES: hypothetical protein [unclassified Paenibacillus]|uniref:hypothetical protein n=1 Tax=unclassified Paenibacillus TaxID=185978 RepID=UPI0008B4A949|nr:MULTISPECIES: hypothetical protein [unclassified Paenibacillus]SEK83724.1 hypothetical protein SAMN05518856_105119 [Paenibacillus sp. OK003]SLK01737.1 hypothetical protein SAMN06272722_103120 [Paenibacillus sp. RU5A]SOC68808.1 hypothetical protein SAMN05880581_103120 [Paenibacillus sp. RU26A]SOC71255.1 hypothetical protein SAMN05880586_103120 [Paenibacillus sp. RU5M]
MPNQDEIIEQATQVGQQYFIDQYNTEVEFTDHKFMPKDLSHNVSLSGHVQDDKETEISILIDYDTFKVQTAIVPKELLKQKKN